MNTPRTLLTCFAALLCGLAPFRAAAGPAFVYATPGEFIANGDFNGDGIPDILVLDKSTGNARVGYGGAGGALYWSAPLATGVQNPSGLAVGRFQQTTRDTIAVTAPYFNLVNLVDLSQTNTAGAPVAVTPPGVGPHDVLPLANAAGGAAPAYNSLVIASSDNVSNNEYLDLMSLNAGVAAETGEYLASGPFDRANALQLSATPPTFGVGLVRGATNDTFNIWQFTNSPAAMLAVSNLVAGGDYVFGIFNEQSLPEFIFYEQGSNYLTVDPLLSANGGLAFGPPQTYSVPEPIEQIYYLDLNGHGDGDALILFTNGVEGMTLVGGVPAFSQMYASGAAAGDYFTGIAPLGAGQFALLDGPPGSLSSLHAQVISFNGAAFTQLSSSYLPATTTRGTRANVWLFQTEPFVNRNAGLIAATNKSDWTDIVTNLPNAIQVTTETDGGTNTGLGGATSTSLGTAPGGSVYGLANQYSAQISLFSYGGTQGPPPAYMTIEPPAGSYTGPLTVYFTNVSPSTTISYRITGSGVGPWQTYSAAFMLTNDSTVEFYGNASGQPLRSQLQFAAYSLNNNNQPSQLNNEIESHTVVSNSYQLPSVLVDSASGTLFYGRRSASNVGSVWAIHMDGSDDTYITNGVRPRASHDGRWLAFMREGDPFNNQGNLWIRNLLTGVEQRLLVNTSKIVCYDWESDDSGLAVDYGGVIYKLALNGSLTPLVQSDGSAEAPALNPTNNGLAYFDPAANSGLSGLFNDPFAGMAPAWVPAWDIVTDTPGASWPSWSPDGQLLCFADGNSLQSVDDGTNLWLVAKDGSTLNRVCDFTGTDNRFPHGALWNLDGNSLVGAATIYSSNGLWIITLNADRTDCDGGDPVRLPTTPGDPIDFAGTVIPSTGFYQDGANIVATLPPPATVTNLAAYLNSGPVLLTNLANYSNLSPYDFLPYGLAVDSAGGYVYISDDASIFQYNYNTRSGLKRVEGVYPNTAQLQYDETGDPYGYIGYEGLATDQSGDLYFAMHAFGTVCELTAAELADGVTNYVFPSDPNYNFELLEHIPNSLAVDGHGDLFVDNYLGNSIIELPYETTDYGNPFYLPNQPGGMGPLAADATGNLYALGFTNNILYNYVVGTGQWNQLVNLTNLYPGKWQFESRFSAYSPNVLTVDGQGNVFISGESAILNSGLVSWNAARGGLETWGGDEDFNESYDDWAAIAADKIGDVFLMEQTGQALWQLQPAMVDAETVNVPVSGGAINLPPIISLRGNGSLDLTGPFAPTCSNTNYTLAVGPFGIITVTCPPNDRTNAYAIYSYINVLGVNIPIIQAGAVYDVEPKIALEAPAAGTDSFELFVNPTNAAWAAAPFYYSEWITVNNPQGRGSGKVSFSFSANYGPTRTGGISIGNATITVTQVGAGYASAAAPGTLIPSLVAPNGVAVDLAGDVYVADSGTKTVKEWIAATGNVITVVSSGLADPTGVAVDSSGNLYIADGTGGNIYELPAGSPLPAGGSELVTLASGLGNAAGVAVGGTGTVYYTDSANDFVGEYTASGGAQGVFDFGLNDPTGIAVDIYGNIFIADTGDHAVKEWLANGGGLVTVVSSGLDEPTGVAVDPAGDLFIADTGANAIYELPAGGTLTYIADDPNDVAVGSTGNLYFSDGSLGSVIEWQTAYVDTQPRYETAAAGSDSLPQISPATVDLAGSFAPASDSAWLTVTNTSNGVVTFAFAANYGSSRTAHISVLGESIAITQNPPSFALGSANLVEGPASGKDSVVVAASPPLAAWTASSGASWLHVGAGGPGSSNLIFTFDANPSSTRVGSLTIAGQTLAVTQAGAKYVATGPGGYASNLVTGVNDPESVAVDGQGNIYIASGYSYSIEKWTEATGALSTFENLGELPQSIAADAYGDVYYLIQGNVYELSPDGGDVNYIYFNVNYGGLAVDPAGNVYISDYENGLVDEWLAASGEIVTLVSSGLSDPLALAADAAGNVYIVNNGTETLKVWSPVTQTLTTLASNSSGFSGAAALAVDGGGNLYLAGSGDAAVQEWSAATGQFTTLVPANAEGGWVPAVAVDSLGNVYLADYDNNEIGELPRAFVDPSPRTESQAGGNDALPVVLPSTEDLGNVFTPASSAAWLTITSTNNGVVSFSFAPNHTGDSPTAQISLLGQTINITQNGPHLLSTATRLEGPSGGNDSVILTVNAAYPGWTVSANDSWLHVAPNSSAGSGNATIVFSYDQTTDAAARTGTLTVGGDTLTVTQAGADYAQATLVTNIVSTGLNHPEGVAVDASGNVYIADTGDAAIKEWSPGPGTLATLVDYGLNEPQGVAVDSSGNVYIADPGGWSLDEWSPTNDTLAYLIDYYVPSLNAYVQPTGVAVDGGGNVYFSDQYNSQVDVYTAGGAGVTNAISSGLNYPQGVAVDFADNVYIADTGNDAVEEWTPAYGLTPLISDYSQAVAVDVAGNVYAAGYYEGTIQEWSAANQSASALPYYGFSEPSGVAVDAAGDVYIADSGNNAIKEAPCAFVPTAAVYEQPNAGSDVLAPVLPSTVNLTGPFMPSSDSPWLTISGAINGVISFSFPANTGPSRVANVTVLGQTIQIYQDSPNSYILGSPTEGPAAATDSLVLGVYPATGTWTVSNIYDAPWLHLSPASQSGTGSALIEFSVDANTGPTRSTELLVSGEYYEVTQAGAGYVPANPVGALVSSGIGSPAGVAMDNYGNVYFADTANNAIKKWSASNNAVATVISTGLNHPTGLASDPYGDLYIADSGDAAVKYWSAYSQTLTTLASSGLVNPQGVAEDFQGNLFITDGGNNSLFKLPNGGSLQTVAASGLNDPAGLAVDWAGNVYIASSGNNTVYEWSPVTSNLTAVVSAGLSQPAAVGVDQAGNVYIADSGHNAIKKWSAVSNSIVPLVASGLSSPAGLYVDYSGDVYIADTGNNAIKECPHALVNTATRLETGAMGVDGLPPVLPQQYPLAQSLIGPFAPTSDASWLTITATNNGVVDFAFQANIGAPRSGHLTVFGQPVTVTQSGPSFVLGSTNRVEGPAAGRDSVVLAAIPYIASWSATANASWLHLSSGYANGIGSTNVLFSFDANNGATRTGNFTIGGQTLAVTQAGATYVAASWLTNLESNLSDPDSVAVDGSGNVFYSTSGAYVNEWNPRTDSVDGSWGVYGLSGVAVDSYDDLFMSDSFYDTGIEFSVTNGYMWFDYGGLNDPTGVAVDRSGNVYFADTGNASIVEWLPNTQSAATLVSTGLQSPTGVAVDAADNVYIADSGAGKIFKWTLATGQLTTVVASGLNSPNNLAVDGAGNVYIADTGDNLIKEWVAASNTVVTLPPTGLNAPAAVAADALGNVYIADSGNNAVKELARAWVDPTAKTEGPAAGTDSLPVLLPAAENLNVPFAPTSDQSWLTITSTNNGVVAFAFTAAVANRTAHITVLGQSVSVVQTGSGAPTLAAQVLANGSLQITFAGNAANTYTVLATTDLTLPLAQWTVLGAATGNGSGSFEFTTPATASHAQEYFIVSTPETPVSRPASPSQP